MILINFSHKLTPAQLGQVEALAGAPIERVIDVDSLVDPEQPIVPQVMAMADRAGLSPSEWQSLPLLVNPPSLNIIAATLLAELHGRCGYFPVHLRLRRAQASAIEQFEAAELVRLQSVRDTARARRGKGDAG